MSFPTFRTAVAVTHSWVGSSFTREDTRGVLGVTVRRKSRWTSADATPARKLLTPPDGNRSRLFLGNEKHSFLGIFPAGSRGSASALCRRVSVSA